MDDPHPEVYSTAEVAARLSITTGRVRQLAIDLEIGRKLSERVRVFTAADVAALAARRTRSSPRPRPQQEAE